MSHSDINLWDIRVGDVLDRLREMPDESVHTCITSPPYWNLRNYGVDGQLGLEAAPEEYVTKMVEVFRSVWRVLRTDGTLWLNIGDSYCSTAPGTMGDPLRQKGILSGVRNETAEARRKFRPKTPSGLKPKDLVGIPWRIAFALQADGWYLRQDLIWLKPSVMPESVTDRCTKAHEYLFLLTKAPKYFYDAEAIKVPCSPKTFTVHTTPIKGTGTESTGEKLNQWMGENGGRYHPLKANKRSVWTVAAQPFKGAHFATFPPKLIEPCVLAGTSAHGCCVSCGSPWKQERIRTSVERSDFKGSRFDSGKTTARDGGDRTQAGDRFVNVSGNWTPTCDCVPNAPVPCTVLDPFVGAGTTLLVATQHNRASIGIELNPEYAEIARQRLLAPPKPKKTSRKKAPSIAPPPSLQPLPLFIQ